MTSSGTRIVGKWHQDQGCHMLWRVMACAWVSENQLLTHKATQVGGLEPNSLLQDIQKFPALESNWEFGSSSHENLLEKKYAWITWTTQRTHNIWIKMCTCSKGNKVSSTSKQAHLEGQHTAQCSRAELVCTMEEKNCSWRLKSID